MDKTELTLKQMQQLDMAHARYEYLHDFYLDSDYELYPDLLAKFQESPQTEKEMILLWINFNPESPLENTTLK